MPLEPQTKIGVYEILAQIGAGETGEVYKATDSQRDRTVALKALPPHLSGESELKQRLERESQTVAALKHPNICTVFEIVSAGQTEFIVMEYVEGETLADRLKRGAVELDEALKVSIAILDALDKAHRQGVTHRDLSPSNIMLTPAGPKLLDLGLAALKQPPPPTVSASAVTRAASFLAPANVSGNLQYQTPEQLEGKNVDARTDIFAFGAILYEMVTGKPAFEGKTTPLVMAAIVSVDPEPVSKLRPGAPPALDYAIKRCLAKDPKQRVQTAWDLLVQLQWIAEGGAQIGIAAPSAAQRQKSDRLALVALAVCILLAVVLAFPAYRYFRSPMTAEAVRFQTVSMNFGSPSTLAVSPDGRWIVFRAQDEGSALYLLGMDSVTPRRLPGTEEVGGNRLQPFWSPDSRSIGFLTDGKLKKVDVAGGPPTTIGDAPNPSYGTWNSDGVILLGSTDGPLRRILAVGGQPEPLNTLDASQEESAHVMPFFLPDGRHYLYLAVSSKGNAVFAGALDSKDRTRLFSTNSRVLYAAPGYLFFHREGTLFAQAFDAKTLKLAGDPIRVADKVPNNTVFGQAAGGAFSVSQTGVLAFRTDPSGQSQGTSQNASANANVGQAAPEVVLRWLDRSGKPISQVGPPGGYLGVDLSPDGKKVATHRHDADLGDIWIFDSDRNNVESRLTFEASLDNSSPIWSPDGTKIAFAARRSGKSSLYVKPADNTAKEELLTESDRRLMPMSWSPDGKYVVYLVEGGRASPNDQWIVPLTGDKKPRALFNNPTANEINPQISPDGKWIAYSSNETADTFQIYVRPFPEGPGQFQISTGGGYFPRWRHDGKELYFLTGGGGNNGTGAEAGNVMAVDISVVGSSVQHGQAHALFPSGFRNTRHENENPFAYHPYAVSADGQRFLIPQQAGRGGVGGGYADQILARAERGGSGGDAAAVNPGTIPITVVLNWTAILRQK